MRDITRHSSRLNHHTHYYEHSVSHIKSFYPPDIYECWPILLLRVGLENGNVVRGNNKTWWAGTTLSGLDSN